LLSPKQRREIFRSEVEKEEAQKLLRREQGAQKKSILLRRYGMPTAVLRCGEGEEEGEGK
jgi:hypothetical protein